MIQFARNPQPLRDLLKLRHPRSRFGWLISGALLALGGHGLPCAAAPSSGPEIEWVAEGPGPIENGQVEGIQDLEVVGAINSIAAHPKEPDILYAGAVNGGIWKTKNATAARVLWVRQTDGEASLSIGTLEFDPTDSTHRTLVAGIGRFSSFGRTGGSRTGLLRTTDGGARWTAITAMATRNIVGVAPRGETLVAAVDDADSFTCEQLGIWRSTDTGASWGRASGIPRGAADALAGDPTDPSILYASLVLAGSCDGDVNGIYKSVDTGATWSKISNAAMDALLTDSRRTNVDITVGTKNNLFVAIIPTRGKLGGVFRSGDGGATWAAMDLPGTLELPGPGFMGIHPGSQGRIHSSLAADPTDPNLVYIGGDRQPPGFMGQGSFPNSLGALDFTGRLFRGDASAPPDGQFTALTHSGTLSGSAPHADSRDLAFDAAGNLIEADDGGIYKRTSPTTSDGDWFSLNGSIQTTEVHDLAFDRLNGILQVGNQDTGTAYQRLPGNARWDSAHTDDGGDVLIDTTSSPGFSIRYSSSQGFAGFRRRVYDAANELRSEVFPALTVIGGGAPFVPQFTVPTALNNVDATRLVIGGGNSVYESTDQGETITEIGPGIVVRGFGQNTISAGADGNADVLYIGACIGSCIDSGDGLDGVFVRRAKGGPLLHSLSVAEGDLIQGIAGNPAAAGEAFAIDSASVYATVDTGTSWTDVTGNLGSFSPGNLRSIEFASNGSTQALLAGTDRGVYLSFRSSGFAAWKPLGTGLPNAPVFDLDYDPDGDTLFVGTLGRGAFRSKPILGPRSLPSARDPER